MNTDDKTILNWILASYLAGGVVFTFVGIRMVPKAREAFDRIAVRGPFFILGEVILSTILWLPLLIVGYWMEHRRAQRIQRIMLLKAKKEIIIESMTKMTTFCRQVEEIREEGRTLGSAVTPVQLHDIHERLSKSEHEMSRIMVDLLEGHCVSCSGQVTATTPGGAPGVVCGSCGEFYHVHEFEKVIPVLKARPDSGWTLKPPA